MNLRRLDAEAPHIDAVKLEHGQDGRVTARRLAVVSLEYLDQTQFALEKPSCPHQPVVEVARQDQGRIVRHHSPHARDDHRQLAFAPTFGQAEMHVDAVHRHGDAGHLDLAMQHAAALERMGGDVLVLPGENLVARQDGIAVVAGVVDTVLAIGEIGIDLAGQEFMLGPVGPVLETAGTQSMTALHFLQKNDVGSQRAETVTQLMHRQAPVELRQALMDVVTGDMQRRDHKPIIGAWAAGESPLHCWMKSSAQPPHPRAATHNADAHAAPA